MQLEHRNLLIDSIPRILANRLNFENLLRAIGQAAIIAEFPSNASYNVVAAFTVDAAVARNWIQVLVTRLVQDFPGTAELDAVNRHLALERVVPTTKEPFDEVLLEGDRPFVNRRPLRNALLRLVNVDGDRVLLVDGDKQTGKSFSYYLLRHAATRRGFEVNKFEISKYASLPQLGEEIIRWLSFDPKLPEQGTESAERWAERIATIVANAVRANEKTRFLVFDEFPSVPVLPEIQSFLIRLARFADEELRDLLRVVFVKFPGQLPEALDDVAGRDSAHPFTSSDMLATLVQIVTARKWPVTEAALKAKVDEFEAQPRKLRERFLFLRQLVLQLAEAAKTVGPQQ
jgi:hypothetical protein